MRRTARLCAALGLTREELHQLPAHVVDELLAAEDAREEVLAELKERDLGRDADHQTQ